MAQQSTLTSIWSNPLWLLSLALFICGALITLFLLKKTNHEKQQQARLTRYLNSDSHSTTNPNQQLFTQHHDLSWREQEYAKLTLALQGAGFYHKHAVRTLLQVKFGGALLILIISALVMGINVESNTGELFKVFALAFAANLAPEYYLRLRQSARKAAIVRDLPDNLELLIICLEAGSTLDRSLALVSSQLADIQPELSREWQQTLAHFKVNPDRQAVLNNLAQRNQLDEMSALVTVLNQAEKFGSPLAQSLRNFAMETRELRKINLEEKVAKLSAQITVPMLLLIFLPMLVMIVAPFFSQLSNALKGM